MMTRGAMATMAGLGAPSLLGEVSERLSTSTLMACGGAAVVRLVDEPTLNALRAEALERSADAEAVWVATPRDEDTRRGDPDRWMDWVAGGPALHAFYHAPHVLETLRRLTTVRWRPSGERGSFSYYRRPGHYLGLHRDVDICDLAVITCIEERRPREGAGGLLRLYPGRTGERLSQIRRSPEDGAVYLRLQPGTSLVLLGGMIPHWLLPVSPGQVRIVSPLCYRPEV